MTRPAPWFISTLCTSAAAHVGAALFGFAFLGAGLAFLTFFIFPPFMDARRAESWIQTPATIVDSQLKSSRSSKGSTLYRVLIRYRYRFGEREYTGDRYNFAKGSTNLGVAAMQDAVARYRLGTEVSVWVNPAVPAESVIDRSLPQGMALWSLFSFPFLLVGCTATGLALFGPMIARGLKSRRTAQLEQLLLRGELHWPRALPPDLWERPDVAVLFSRDRRLGQAVLYTGIALFWDGLVSIFVTALLTDRPSFGKHEVLAWLFLSPFILIGIALIFKCLHGWQNLRRPDWIALLAPVPGQAGGEVELALAFPRHPLRASAPAAQVDLVAVAAAIDAKNRQPSPAPRRNDIARRKPEGMGRTEHELARVRVDLNAARGYTKVQLPSVDVPTHLAKDHGLLWWLELETESGEVESQLASQEDRSRKNTGGHIPPPPPPRR